MLHITAVAISTFQSTVYSEVNELSPTVMGQLSGESMNVRAKVNSFQARIMEYIPVATSPGVDNGSITRNNAGIGEHPSIRAASSSSRGMVSKYAFIIHVHSGILKEV